MISSIHSLKIHHGEAFTYIEPFTPHSPVRSVQMLSPLWLMWKVGCGKAGYFAAGLVASEQGRRPGLGRTCLGALPLDFRGTHWVAPDYSDWRRLLAAVCRLGGVSCALVCWPFLQVTNLTVVI